MITDLKRNGSSCSEPPLERDEPTEAGNLVEPKIVVKGKIEESPTEVLPSG
jgi:hypothetical protein